MELEKVIRKYEVDLLCLPNVVGVGMGILHEKEVIQVFVSKKLPRSRLREEDLIPAQLDTYPTNIIEVGFITNQ